MPRAWALARQLAALPTLTLRYMRVATAQRLKELVVREVGPRAGAAGTERRGAGQSRTRSVGAGF
jgi:hypothetical protein